MDIASASTRSLRPAIVPRWVDPLLIGFAAYSLIGAAWMLSGIGGPKVIYDLGLFAKMPAELVCIFVAAATAQRMLMFWRTRHPA